MTATAISKPVMIEGSTGVRRAHTLDFPQAMANIIAGKQITKLEWNDNDQYAELRPATLPDGSLRDMLMLHLADGWHLWMISRGDLEGTDWVLRS